MSVRVSGRRATADVRTVWRAFRVEVYEVPRGLWIWLGILGALALLGALAAVRSLFPGDKGLGTTPTFEWGLLIVGYVFFAITTSGLCLASSLGTVFGIDRFRPLERRHAVLAVLCLTTAFGLIALDLHYPVRLVFGAVLNPTPSSPMWWMGVFYGIYFGSLLLEVWSMFWGHARIHGFACLFSSCMAVIAPATLGAVFGVLAARSFWHGPFTPLLMVASAFLSGTALLGIVFWAVARFRLTGYERAGTVAIPAIRAVLAIALLIVAALVAREIVAGYTTDDAGLARATRALTTGPLALQFWGVRVLGGVLVPLLLLALPWTRTAAGLFAASGLAIVGVFADRLTFVGAGQIAPTTAVSGVVSAPYAAYTPSLVEIGILTGAAALVTIGYTLAERYVDLGETDVHAVLSPAAIRGYGDRLRGSLRASRSAVEALRKPTPVRAGGGTIIDVSREDAPESPAPGPGSLSDAQVEAGEIGATDVQRTRDVQLAPDVQPTPDVPLTPDAPLTPDVPLAPATGTPSPAESPPAAAVERIGGEE